MTVRKFLLGFALPLLLLAAVSCDTLNDLTKTDYEKKLSYLTKEWIVDSVRVRTYGFITGPPVQAPLAKDTLLPIVRVKIERGSSALVEGPFTQISLVNGKEVKNVIRWRYDETYFRLFYPNPNPGLTDVEVIYTVVELTDGNFHFKRDENLVTDITNIRYGSKLQTWKMHK